MSDVPRLKKIINNDRNSASQSDWSDRKGSLFESFPFAGQRRPGKRKPETKNRKVLVFPLFSTFRFCFPSFFYVVGELKKKTSLLLCEVIRVDSITVRGCRHHSFSCRSRLPIVKKRNQKKGNFAGKEKRKFSV